MKATVTTMRPVGSWAPGVTYIEATTSNEILIVFGRSDSGVVSVGANVSKDTTRPRLSAPIPHALALGGKAGMTYMVKDTYSTLALVTATVTRPSGALVKSFHFGWVRVGQKYVCVFKPAIAGHYYVTFRAKDLALNSAVPVVIHLIVK